LANGPSIKKFSFHNNPCDIIDYTIVIANSRADHKVTYLLISISALIFIGQYWNAHFVKSHFSIRIPRNIQSIYVGLMPVFYNLGD